MSFKQKERHTDLSATKLCENHRISLHKCSSKTQADQLVKVHEKNGSTYKSDVHFYHNCGSR